MCFPFLGTYQRCSGQIQVFSYSFVLVVFLFFAVCEFVCCICHVAQFGSTGSHDAAVTVGITQTDTGTVGVD